jgi:serine O-acetyltransferase
VKTKMHTAIDREQLYQMVVRQLENLLIFDREKEGGLLREVMGHTLLDLEHCFSRISHFYLWENDTLIFNPFHTCQNTVFIYKLSRSAFSKFGDKHLAERLYYLNKILHGVDLFYEVDLPLIWYCEHPTGSVMGRAKYADYFFFSQNCTVGGNYDIYPTFEENVMLMSGVTIIGKCQIGRNTVFSTQAFVKEQDVPSNVVVFGKSPDLVFKDIDRFDLTLFKVFDI